MCWKYLRLRCMIVLTEQQLIGLLALPELSVFQLTVLFGFKFLNSSHELP